MAQRDGDQFTIGVFQDALWAERGLEALKAHSFPSQTLSIIAKDGPETAALVERTIGTVPSRMTVPRLGPVVATGSLVDALEEKAGDLTRLGLAATLKRVGFQTHDGQIFETLTGKGGVLVAIKGDARAADALAVLHSFGGGNAAIGAWTGRL